jgi:hypothetical protein
MHVDVHQVKLYIICQVHTYYIRGIRFAMKLFLYFLILTRLGSSFLIAGGIKIHLQVHVVVVFVYIKNLERLSCTWEL